MDEGDDDYEVGYGKPPKNTQFKKGKSGNPKGRPKDEPIEMSFFRTLEQCLDRQITIKSVDGKPLYIQKKALIIERLLNQCANGDTKSIRALNEIIKNQKDWSWF